MRKVSKTVVGAFTDGRPARCKNTVSTGTELFLHGNLIAWWVDGNCYCTLAGWNTPTTRERLNALHTLLRKPAPFHQKNYAAMYNGHPIGDREVFHVA